MKFLEAYELFERKNNYQLFHKTTSLIEILREGYIVAGGHDSDGMIWWNTELRRNVIANWKKNKFVTISATRNLDYFGLPALELDVEKISDKYRILPYIENLDYYGDFEENKLKTTPNKNLKVFQRQLRSKSKNAGKEFWKIKTKKGSWDFGINEEIILADKLDVSKYVKRIILSKPSKYNFNENKNIIKLINDRYPHIDIVEIDNSGKNTGHYNYINVKKELKDREVKIKEPVLAEKLNFVKFSNLDNLVDTIKNKFELRLEQEFSKYLTPSTINLLGKDVKVFLLEPDYGVKISMDFQKYPYKTIANVCSVVHISDGKWRRGAYTKFVFESLLPLFYIPALEKFVSDYMIKLKDNNIKRLERNFKKDMKKYNI